VFFLGFKERFAILLGEKRGEATRLATAIGASTGLVTAWKTGDKKPSLEYITKIAEYFGVSTDYLLKGDTLPTEEEIKLVADFFKAPVDVFLEEIKKGNITLNQVGGMADILSNPIIMNFSSGETKKESTQEERLIQAFLSALKQNDVI
jgi:transcriptional regulator with XRE-family HTH domain